MPLFLVPTTYIPLTNPMNPLKIRSFPGRSPIIIGGWRDIDLTISQEIKRPRRGVSVIVFIYWVYVLFFWLNIEFIYLNQLSDYLIN